MSMKLIVPATRLDRELGRWVREAQKNHSPVKIQSTDFPEKAFNFKWISMVGVF